MRRAVLAAIRIYQRYLSPYKGFRCAYREHTGRASCSALGYRAVRRHGVFGGLALIDQRTRRCGVAHRRYAASRCTRLHAQRGVCDIGCDLPCDVGCDLPSGRGLSRACDFLSCCDCAGCDWSDRKRKRSANEQYVYIPPRSRSSVEASSRQSVDRDA
jgi:uncharacterized protein